MKVLFSALHLAYFRNFESVIRELAERGHQVHLVGDEPEGMGGEGLATRLTDEYPGVTFDLLPSLEREPWFEATRSLRVSLDYVRVLDRRYAPKLRMRARGRTARIARWLGELPVVGQPLTCAALKAFERAMPSSRLIEDYLRRQAPDVVVLASLTYSRSQQMDVLKAARNVGIPVAAAIMSWDHLSSKALVHVSPDMVLVWNEVQRREAVEMHGLPDDRIVVTGAQCYDQWFTRRPARTREEFCRQMGLRPDRPFVLWVHSALSPTPEPPEPILVTRWLEALRRSTDPGLRETGVLVRPHPERRKEWNGIDLTGFENVAFNGRNPIDPAAKDDYFDALYYSGAVIGLVTSSFLEAAIVGRPVLTLTVPEYRLHQEEMIHFQYLTQIEGGLLRVAPDMPTHFEQLREALALGGARDERNRRFLNAFVRPGGLDAEATPVFAAAVERLAAAGPRPPISRPVPALVTGAAMRLATLSQTGIGRWLVNDIRDDDRDERREYEERVRESRIGKKVAHREMKMRRRVWRQRRERAFHAVKSVRRVIRRTRARVVERTKWLLLVVVPGGVRRVRKQGRRVSARARYWTATTTYRVMDLVRLRGGGD